MIPSLQIGQIEIDEEDPWSGVLVTLFTTRATSQHQIRCKLETNS